MKFLLSTTLIVMVLAVSVCAQTANPGTTRFEKNDLAFDFPAEWKLIDSSADNVQHVAVAPKGSVNKIAVFLQGGAIRSCDFIELR